MMKQFYLVDIVTQDKLQHQGIYFEPAKRGKIAILWVHGLSGSVFEDTSLMNSFATECNRAGMGFAAFNNRGRNLIAGIRKMDGSAPKGYSYFPGGAGQEVFEESTHDIEAGIHFLVEKGYSHIVVVGHSTGANKVCYFAGTRKNPYVSGVVLAGPMSDRLDTSIDREKLRKDLAYMYRLIKEEKGDELLLGYHFFPMTPKRFVSLFAAGTPEDVFDYGDKHPKMKLFSQITLPLLVLLAGADEYADRPVSEIKKVFDGRAKSQRYTSVIIPGVPHKFQGKEKTAAAAVIAWSKSL